MDFARRKELYNLCHPEHSLAPDDPRNVDIDEMTDGTARGARWAALLAQQILLADTPPCLLVTGLPGSGKSTELRRLSGLLASGAGLLPVIADAEDLIDSSNPIDVPDLLTAILFAAEREVLQAELKDPELAATSGYLARFWTWLTKTDVTLGTAEFGIGDVGKLVFELKTRPNLRQRVRETVSSHLNSWLKEVRNELTSLDQRARQRGYAGIVVIFDSLEKLRGTTSNWYDVLYSAEAIFKDGAPYLQIPVPVVYTVPSALIMRINGVQFMPMVKIHDRAGHSYKPGMNAARELVRRRIPDDALDELLGPDVREERLRDLIAWSGGYPREILMLLRAVLLEETHLPVSKQRFHRHWIRLRDTYRHLVPADAFPWLARVAQDHFLTLADDAHRLSADRMMSVNAVLHYLNDEGWYDLHPAVREIPGVQDAIAALGRGDVSAG